MIRNIQKRDGQIVEFDPVKILEAIWKAAQSVGGTDKEMAGKIANQVIAVLEVFFKDPKNIPNVEQIQDLVEKILIESGHAKTAKAFIVYREQHKQLREEKNKILGENNEVIMKFPENANIQDVKEFLALAEKIGCTYKNFKPNIQPSLFDQEQKSLKKTEEVIPPPIEALI